MVPASGAYTPLITLSRLDFPAPLGPMIAQTSPSWTWKSTPAERVHPAEAQRDAPHLEQQRAGHPALHQAALRSASSSTIIASRMGRSA